MNESDFQSWLQSRQATTVTPVEVIGKYVQAATGSPIKTHHRLMAGKTGEIYDTTTVDGRRLNIRLSHAEDIRLKAESWALSAARDNGVPAPRILLLEQIRHGDRKLTLCIEERRPGTPLDQLLQASSAGALGLEPAAVARTLGAIHATKVEGFGYLQPGGKGWNTDFAHIMLDLQDKGGRLHDAAAWWGVPAPAVDDGLALLAGHESLYRYDKPVLVHGDFIPTHVLVDHGEVTGVIEFDKCSGNHPVMDFVQWHTAVSVLKYPITVTELKAGYPDQTLFDGQFDVLFNLALLRRSLWMLIVRIEQNNPVGISHIKDNLAEALKALQ